MFAALSGSRFAQGIMQGGDILVCIDILQEKKNM